MSRQPWRARRLAEPPIAVACEVIASGDAAAWSRSALEPVVAAMAESWFYPSQPTRFTRARQGTSRVFDWLQAQPGDNWMQRWTTSTADLQPADWTNLAGVQSRYELAGAQLAVEALIVLRAVRPTYEWLLGAMRLALQDRWSTHHDAALFTTLRAQLDSGDASTRVITDVLAHLFRMAVVSGHDLGELTDADFRDCRAGLLRAGRRSSLNLDAAWRLLRQHGLLAGQPDELAHALARAKLTPAELVDRYGVRDPGIRDLFVDYLTEREPSCDYTTLAAIARGLVSRFWVDLQQHEPGIATLALTAEQAHAWKRRLQTQADGRPRREWPAIAQQVRSFYLDLSAWAQDEPARWGPWVAPCPIGNRELRMLAPRRRRRQIAEMNARTRSLSPVLPQLVAAVTSEFHRSEQLLAAATRAAPGQTFTVADQHWHAPPQTRQPQLFRPSDVTAVDFEGRRVNLTKQEDRAFWTWAIIEVLRHTGIRIEELLELTHLSLRPFRKPDGQIIPLLQIAPSKNDAERVLPVGPELAHALSRIITRLTGPAGDSGAARTVPLLSRWDPHERVHSPAMPFLFQRSFLNGRRSIICDSTVRNWLASAATAAGLRDVDGSPLRFTPHDFRRVFLTDAVRNGLPIHIAAQLAGHDDLNTTRRYAATYPIEVIEHYQRFLARRRAERPVDEYRQPTPEELAAFAEHFGRRRVELGDCVRPYGTGCTHEHACLRCSFLQIDPHQAGRLTIIETDLNARIDTARDKAWLGDVEQLQVTLGHLHDKQDQLQRLLEAMPARPLIAAAPILGT